MAVFSPTPGISWTDLSIIGSEMKLQYFLVVEELDVVPFVAVEIVSSCFFFTKNTEQREAS